MSDDPKGFNPEYDDNRLNDIIYFGRANTNPDGTTYRKVELFVNEDVSFLSEKNADDKSKPVEFTIRKDVTLFQVPSGQQKIQCWLMESKAGKYVEAVHISRRTGKGVYGSQEVTLSLGALVALQQFMKSLFVVDTNERVQLPITTQNVDEDGTRKVVSEKEFADLIRANIKSTDDFYKLLSIQKMELAVEQLEHIMTGDYKNEVEIQSFLKSNIWMFGNDYSYIVQNGRINTQNILDMVPQNYESYIDIIEVKLPKEKLFNYDDSHNNYYSTSALTKAIAQTQNYIFELEKKTVDEVYQSKNECKVIRPKGIILFGSSVPLNDEEKQYLRILNSSYHNIQIITYQQLMEKSKNTLSAWKNRSF